MIQKPMQKTQKAILAIVIFVLAMMWTIWFAGMKADAAGNWQSMDGLVYTQTFGDITWTFVETDHETGSGKIISESIGVTTPCTDWCCIYFEGSYTTDRDAQTITIYFDNNGDYIYMHSSMAHRNIAFVSGRTYAMATSSFQDTAMFRTGCLHYQPRTHTAASRSGSCRSCGTVEYWECPCGAKLNAESGGNVLTDLSDNTFGPHNMGSGWDQDNHFMKCRNWGCSYTEQTEAHIYDNAQDRICDTCGWTRDPHSCTMGSDWVNTDPDKHWLAYCTDPTCLYKDNKSWESYHVYDNAQDTICNTCGYERPEHVCAQGTNLVTTDPDSHWYPACTDPTCLYKDNKISEQAHVFDDAQDRSCDICGHIRPEHICTPDTAWVHAGDSTHWHPACSDPTCIHKDDRNSEQAHVFDNAQDTICNDCGSGRDEHICTPETAWINTNSSTHWHTACTDPTCLYNDDKADEAAHVYDNAQDTICNICGYERPEHICTPGTTLVTTDPDSHWYPACTDPACIHKDDRVSEQAHGYDNGQDSICDACGAVRTVDPAPQPTPEENEKPAQSENISGVLIVSGKPGNKKITLQWNEIKGASSYTVYSSVCNGKAYKRIKTVTGTKYVVKNLNNKKEYKFYVKANGTNNTIASTTCHVAMSKDKRTNPKSIKLNFKRTSLKAGAEKTIKATVKKEKSGKKLLGHAAKVRYYSSDASVAKVNEKGKISAVSKGTAVIYAVTENGLFKTVSVTVK